MRTGVIWLCNEEAVATNHAKGSGQTFPQLRGSGKNVTTKSKRTSWFRFVFCRSRRMCYYPREASSFRVEVVISKENGHIETGE